MTNRINTDINWNSPAEVRAYADELDKRLEEREDFIEEISANANLNGRKAANQAIQLRKLNEVIQRKNYTIRSLRTRLVDALNALAYTRGETDSEWPLTVQS